MENNREEINYFLDKLPKILGSIVKSRKDLIDLKIYLPENERKLVRWLLNHGQFEYKDLFSGYSDDNEIIEWLSQKSLDTNFSNLPRIVLGIWDTFKSHRRRWPNPGENNSYLRWIQINWNDIPLKKPDYVTFFGIKKEDIWFYSVQNWILNLVWFFNKSLILKMQKYEKSRIFESTNNKLKGWSIQRSVVDALIYRELKTRVSQVRGGILGVFIEPLGVMAVFLVLFTLLRGNKGSLDILLFLGSGIVLFTLFSDIAIRSSNAMLANEALFYYRPVKPIDTVIARTLVESGLYAIVFLVIILGTFLLRETIIIDNILLLIFSYLGLVVFSFGVGVILMVATFIYPSIIQFIPLMMRPLWFISGIFLSLNSLPSWIRPYLSWNPIFQAIELTRHSFTKNYYLNYDEVSMIYLWQCAFISLFLGLWLYSNNEKNLLTR